MEKTVCVLSWATQWLRGGSDTTALTDEEIQAAIDIYQRSWKKAKLMLLESL